MRAYNASLTAAAEASESGDESGAASAAADERDAAASLDAAGCDVRLLVVEETPRSLVVAVPS